MRLSGRVTNTSCWQTSPPRSNSFRSYLHPWTVRRPLELLQNLHIWNFKIVRSTRCRIYLTPASHQYAKLMGHRNAHPMPPFQFSVLCICSTQLELISHITQISFVNHPYSLIQFCIDKYAIFTKNICKVVFEFVIWKHCVTVFPYHKFKKCFITV